MTTIATAPATPPLYRTSIGKKMLMAASGLVILLWLIGHMLGNLKVWLNQREFDSYAEFLRRLGEPIFPHTVFLWLIRVVLTVAFVVHVYLAVDLSRRNRRARQTRYVRTARVQADMPAVTMRWGGLALALFVIFHLANFTWGWIHPGYRFVRGSVYANVVGNFDQWWLVAIYVAAMVALALHIYHGTWSIFQTFGANSRRWDRLIRRSAGALAIVMFVGFVSVPVGVLVGAIQ
ncbi:MAG: succinate dehydrogenase / fumarate reductase, cytochrome b subunit [Acidimicrobiaceae bacterium]|jgi:succinate dehydrogenase / fumarate reductase cytochrome b subunit|nr:succinate dehydrogenase / fumarate reductase, cytochrome b subunit [Acidimicrobiaceae bacterium]MDQ1364174.1 succinate dehydrogenase / fumarate reductase, cytochrome b subunit [Acidimicrobiaceae bacterium]MDQ1440396.1 succinate dehydrogenase / fumarate reductase, cytochrome b subunit [Acidimicrobiaceae bacterium]